MEELEVIAIDHGWSLMKTPSSVFVSGIKEITTKPALITCFCTKENITE